MGIVYISSVTMQEQFFVRPLDSPPLDKLASLCQIWHTMSNGERPKPLYWVGSTKRNLKSFSLEVRRTMGFALYQAQVGGKHLHAKPLKGFGGAGVLEVIDAH